MIGSEKPINPIPGKAGVAVVVPCFNEQAGLPHLCTKLRSVRELLNEKYAVRLIFVDDGSTDGTWRVLQGLFGSDADCTLVRQKENRGIAASILAGIRKANTEIVCSIDSDCSYDPHQLRSLISMFTPGVHFVAESPYPP